MAIARVVMKLIRRHREDACPVRRLSLKHLQRAPSISHSDAQSSMSHSDAQSSLSHSNAESHANQPQGIPPENQGAQRLEGMPSTPRGHAIMSLVAFVECMLRMLQLASSTRAPSSPANARHPPLASCGNS